MDRSIEQYLELPYTIEDEGVSLNQFINVALALAVGQGLTPDDALRRADDVGADGRRRVEELAGEAREKATELQQRARWVLEERPVRLEQAVEAGRQATRRTRSKP